MLQNPVHVVLLLVQNKQQNFSFLDFSSDCYANRLEKFHDCSANFCDTLIYRKQKPKL